MRRSLAKFSGSEASNHTPSSAEFTTTTPELKFSVHTAVTGGKIVKTQNRCAHSSVEAVRLVCEHGGHGQNGPQFRTQDAGGCICIVKNLNDGHRAIGEAVIMLTRSLKQFRLDNIEVCCGLQKLDRAMMLQGCRKADRAEVVERDRFATPNSLKSYRQGNLLSPVSNPCARTPKLCMPSRPIHLRKILPGTQITYRG